MVCQSFRPRASAFRRFAESEAKGGLVLMGTAALALALANSPLAPRYAAALATRLAGHSLQHWINDALMAVFFLLVGLEIKREVLHGQLRSWSSRLLPGLGAMAGMAVPSVVFAIAATRSPDAIRGWAVPAATDIAFALGILSLLGDRVPSSLKVFLTALAVLDDLGAVVIIAIFYTNHIALPLLAAAAAVLAALMALNRAGMQRLAPYLLLGIVLWVLVSQAGIHPTVAGVLLGLTVPDRPPMEAAPSPLHRLETTLAPWVAFLILPLFAFANSGVTFGRMDDWLQPVTIAVAAGLALGKQCGVMLAVWGAERLGLARQPAGASWGQVYGVALLCGVGFTMSLFIGLLAFAGRPDLMNETKLGVLAGSLLSATAGTLVLRFAADGRRRRT